MTRLIVVRHGHSTANDRMAFAGHYDAPLTETGKRQAEYAADHLCANEKIDKIVCSDLTRAKQTAMPLAKRLCLPLHADASLREVFGGLWETIPFQEIDRLYHEDWMRWRFCFSDARPTGGESIREHYFRITNAIHRIAQENDGKTVVLFTHCTPVRMISAISQNLPPERVDEAEFPLNASIAIYEYENGALCAEKTNMIVYPVAYSTIPSWPHPPLVADKKGLAC